MSFQAPPPRVGSNYWLAASYVAAIGRGDSKSDVRFVETECGPAEGLVYFIGIDHPSDEHCTHIKIGFTTGNPYARMKSLQTGCPHKMDMIGYIFGNLELERKLHARFADIGTSGEWFEYSDYVASTIDHIMHSESMLCL